MLVSFGFQLSNLGIMTARLLPALQECFKSEYVSVRIEAAMVSSSQNDSTPLTASIFQKTVEFLRAMGAPVEHAAYFPNPFGNFHAFSIPSQGALVFFFNAVSPLLVDVHGSVLAQTHSALRHLHAKRRNNLLSWINSRGT